MSGNILFLGNKIFEIPAFFQTRLGDLSEKVDACSLRFSALKVRWWFGVGLGVRGGWATRFLTRIRPAEDSWPAGLARVVFGNLNEYDTKQKFPRWFQGVFTETSLIATGPYLGFL